MASPGEQPSHSGYAVKLDAAKSSALPETLQQPSEEVAVFKTAVNIRVPEFIPEDPEFWLAQLNSQFATAGITSEKAKFNYLAAAIPRSMAPDVRDLVINPPEHNPFSALRDTILRRTTVSEEKRLRQLLEGTHLDGRTPSQLLRYMRQLAGTTIAEPLLRQLWLRRLPDNIRTTISIFHDQLSLDKLAEGADRAMESHVETVNTVASTSTEMEDMQREMQDLRLTVSKLQFNRRRSRDTRRQSPGSSATTSRPRDICWYHQKYQDKARKCISPCRLAGKLYNRGN